MARKHTRALVAALALGAVLPGTAQAAGFDDTFGINGTVFNSLSPASDRYQGVTRAPGGGTYNVGFTTVAGTDRGMVLTHVDSAGRLDRDFGVNGVALANAVTGPFQPPPGGGTAPNGSVENARGVVVQPDGKIVIVGQAETPPAAGKPDSRDIDIYVARFDTEGVLDPTFGTGGIERIDLSDGRRLRERIDRSGVRARNRPQRQDRRLRLQGPGLRRARPHRPRHRRDPARGRR